ncbi:uncharacterized protein LOC141666917 [Apium graveolens]|uniref:uncharacterized protein LOC141666917 n=1 Tax=Apium graveolens TaxID=4045 RepID=UPI003D7A35E5
MDDSFQSPGPQRNNISTNAINREKASGVRLVSSRSKSFTRESLEKLVTLNGGKFGKGTFGHVAVFLVKVAVLEAVRKLSKSKYPFIWSGLQALQLITYSPFKWMQRWAPFRVLANSMKMLSRPLLFLSIATAFTDEYGSENVISDGLEESHELSNDQAVPGENSDFPSVQSLPDTEINDEATQSLQLTSWLQRFYTEFENEGIALPERINEDELRIFYTAANSDFTSFLSSVKKTIRWRETYRMLSAEELEMWSNLVFWHGTDVKQRPCLVVRLGLACVSLPSSDRPRFAQAVVSQVEFGVLHLVDYQNPQITVLVDCEGLTSLGFPMQMMRSCSTLLQDNFPNRLGCLLVIRLPPVARVIAQTVIQVLKPITRQKLNVIGGMYQNILHSHLQTLPSYLGGVCTCNTCANLDIWLMQPPHIYVAATSQQRNEDNDSSQNFLLPHSSTPVDTYTNGSYDQVLRSAVISILIIWALIAFLSGLTET